MNSSINDDSVMPLSLLTHFENASPHHYQDLMEGRIESFAVSESYRETPSAFPALALWPISFGSFVCETIGELPIEVGVQELQVKLAVHLHVCFKYRHHIRNTGVGQLVQFNVHLK